MINFKISVRSLVELIMRHGSIDNRYVGSNIKALEGIKGHQYIQSSYGDNYSAEVPMLYEYVDNDVTLVVEGRADGILIEDDKVTIDEIKTTVRDLLTIDENFNPLHWEQAKCYGFFYCVQNDLETINIQLTYYNIETENTRILNKEYTVNELREDFEKLAKEYISWCKEDAFWIEQRNQSIKELQFPFDEYRKGQRDLAVRVYKAIEEGKKCFAQAPTGIGKTISTVFPAIKAMGEGLTSKIFYLTAKTITREAAEKSLKLLRNKGLKIKSVTITAKEKVCLMEETNCNPEYCKYANGYFDRINSALRDIITKYSTFDRENILNISKEYNLCPFELSLELTMISDIIICDYNYVFDPKVYLRRFFENKTTDFTFLIDEAHNLIDRGREMYSSTLSMEKLENVRKIISKKDKRLKKVIKEIQLYFDEKQVEVNETKEKALVEKEQPKGIYSSLGFFIKLMDEYLSKNKEENQDVLDFYFEVHSFVAMSEYYNQNYVTLYKNINNYLVTKLYCVNTTEVLQEKMNNGKANVFFSATLLPMDYFKDIFGYSKGDYIVNLQTPFDVSNRLLMIADRVQTTYNMREQTSSEIIEYIISCVNAKKGNYMVFFPSYKYMNMIYDKMNKKQINFNIILQENDMNEEQKEEFIAVFDEKSKKSNLAFCVLGSHFSEGIDLTNDKLIGVIIIGVGMPQIGIDRDIIKDNFLDKNKGFDYAYVYPGIIKVLQAAGRCIRTAEDKGIILLIDSRYSQKKYRELLPKDWENNVSVFNDKNVRKKCELFWEKTIQKNKIHSTYKYIR